MFIAMKNETTENIAQIKSPSGKVWDITEYTGGTRQELTVTGQFGPFLSTLDKAVKSNYTLIWSADASLIQDWKKIQGDMGLPEDKNAISLSQETENSMLSESLPEDLPEPSMGDTLEDVDSEYLENPNHSEAEDVSENALWTEEDLDAF